MRFIRFLAVYTIVGGSAALLVPESVGKLGRWFADNPRYMRLVGMVDIGLGVWLALREYLAKEPPWPWWRRRFEG
jgi:hypothetical protein